MSYWSTSTTQRLTRRRLLAATAGGGAGLALLAACGSSGSGGSNAGSSAPADKSGLLSQLVDTTKQAKRGGVLKMVNTGDVPSLDVHQNYTTNGFFDSVSSHLIHYKAGFKQPSAQEPDADLAQSWEISPDGLQISLKLRPNVKWHNMAPVNGRQFDMDDVLFSWKRFSATGGNRAAISYDANPMAPFLSLTAPDPQTVLIKLKFPIFYAVSLLAAPGVFIVPKEAENQSALDLRNKMIGTGPFTLDNYRQSVSITIKRFPGYWLQDMPFADEVDYPILPEYATALAQLKAGNIYTYGVRQEDVVATKKDQSALAMYPSGVAPDGNRTIFGWKTAAFRDERVRQAMSQSWDRDLWINVAFNADKLEQQGFPIERRWNTAITALDSDASGGWWLDPKGKDFGPNAQYFNLDVANAKKLMAAAGLADGLDVPVHVAQGGGYELNYTKFDVLNGFAKAVGFRFGSSQSTDYNTEFQTAYRDSRGKFEGVSFKAGPTSISGDPVGRLAYDYDSTAGSSFYGYDVNGTGDGSGDPFVDQTIRKAQGETDANKRRPLVQDLQRYLGKAQYGIRWPGGSTNFALAWPALRNYLVWQGGGTYIANLYQWADDTQAPLKKN